MILGVKAESNYDFFKQAFQNLCRLFVLSLSVGEIPSLQGMAAKEPYVGHSAKYSSCVGRSLDDQRRSWMTNSLPHSKSEELLECQWYESVFFCCHCCLLMYFVTLPISSLPSLCTLFEHPLSLLI